MQPLRSPHSRDPRAPWLGAALAGVLFISTMAAAAQDASPATDTPQATDAPARPDAAAEKAPAPAGDKASDKKLMRVYYLGKEYDEPLPLSYAEEIITDKGIQGARLMEKEANQAGNFIGYEFKLEEGIVPKDGDVVAKAKEALAAGHRFILAELEPDDLLAVADLPEAKNALISTFGPAPRSCARRNAAGMSSTSFPTTPCGQTRSPNI